MGNAAIMLRAAGHRVSGADSGVYPPMSVQLERAGIEILEGWDVKRLRALAPDRVIVGNVITRGNPEVEWLLESRLLPFGSLPQLIGEEIIGRRPALVVAGTHGKTTTSALAAFLLQHKRVHPGWLIGGVPLDLPGGAQLGAGAAPFVIEGDEYDSAFFDKRSKFVHYRPHVLALNNLEFDHGDIFRDLADISRSFSHLLRLIPGSGAILYNGDDANLRALLPVPWCPSYAVGTGPDNDLRIVDFKEGASGAAFTLRWRGTLWGKVEWGLPGLYNARNAAVALLAVGLMIKPDDPLCAMDPAALQAFRGVRRRQEVLLDTPSLTVLEDFAHHPTAVAGVLASLRARYAGQRLTACFDPRSNTACTRVFQEAFTDALALADAVYLGPVHRPEKYPEANRLDTAQMAAALNARGCCAGAFASHQALLEELIEATQAKTELRRVTVFFSNGAFGGIMSQYVQSAG